MHRNDRLVRWSLLTTLSVTVTALLVGVPAAHAAPAAGGSLTALVNPFIGTENFGNTFPGASAPFGMVQVSPDTGGQGGYDYKASSKPSPGTTASGSPATTSPPS